MSYFYIVLSHLLLINVLNVECIPVRGNFPWSMILCKFYDVPFEPKTREFFNDWLTDGEDGSISSYFRSVSNGLYTLNGSAVHGWFTMAYRKQAVHFIAEQDSKLEKLYPSEGGLASFNLKFYHKSKELCVETAEAMGARLHKNKIIIINDDNIALFCSQVGILLTPHTLATAALSHEMVHSFHIGHSNSDRQIRIFPYSNLGEYDDPFDLMSTANAFMYSTKYGMAGPGLNGPHLDYLGWLPSDRIYYYGKRREQSAYVKLGSLSLPHSQTGGYLLLYLPVNRENPQDVYAVELRTRHGLDKGLRRPYAVIIRRVKVKRDGYLFSYLSSNSRDRRHEYIQGDRFFQYLDDAGDQYLDVQVIEVKESQAKLFIDLKFSPIRCEPGKETPRLATPDDNVCVSFSERDSIVAENALSEDAEKNDTCPAGLVKRGATPRDDVCVSSRRRIEVMRQNDIFRRYSDFYLHKTWGLNSCQDRYVWRQLDPYDYTCVTKSRKQVNLRQGLSTTRSYQECDDGKIPRLAFAGDYVCVSQGESDAAQRDSWAGKSLLKYQKFFNGIDDVP